jgi:hypothetical protein
VNRDARWVYFHTKNNPNFSIFGSALELKMLVYFMTIWNILRPLGILYIWHFVIVCGLLVYFFPFWYVWTKKNLATPNL